MKLTAIVLSFGILVLFAQFATSAEKNATLHRSVSAVKKSTAHATSADMSATNPKHDDCQCSACCQGRARRARQRDLRMANEWSNCDCKGSYKFPVPPLYTYHWPGMFSQERMTDYHSPWRFPPLRPYVDEEDETPSRHRPTSDKK